MAGTINVNQLIPDPGQDLYINTGQYGANLVVGNATTQLLVVSPQGILSSGGTSALGVPSGTTAQRPANPVVGYIRFNTDTQLLENYTANGWFRVSVQTPTISSISGAIYNGNTSTLTITGQNFGATGANVTFSGANTASVTGLTPTGAGTSLSVTVPSPIYSIIAGSSVGVQVTNSDNATSGAYSMTVIGLPTGGNTITQTGNTRIHTFNASGSLVIPTGFNATASYLIVAGGGGGSGTTNNSGVGGGGAGGLLTGSTSITSGSTYNITVGSGGAGGSSSPGSNGGSSSALSVTATGGGYGGGAGGPGGSGGGAGEGSAGGSGTLGQGYAGGPGAPIYGAGGGGGSSAVGVTGLTNAGGPGGAGTSSSISGSPVTYAGGGGGTCYPGAGGNGSGGSGGGGAGNGTSGTNNTGGGGGGRNTGTGGNGGSGIVIVSYTL